MSLVGRPPLPRHRGRAGVLCCAAVVVGLTSCASGGDPTTNAERVTVTETQTSPATPPASPTSDVKGRRFDVGTVSSVKDVDGVLWLQLDRWTVKGLSDAKLAKDGISVTPHTDARFTNQNNDRLRNVPVAPGATVVVNTCHQADEGQLGLSSSPEAAADWLDDPDSKQVLLLTYDDSGRVVRMDTDPRC